MKTLLIILATRFIHAGMMNGSDAEKLATKLLVNMDPQNGSKRITMNFVPTKIHGHEVLDIPDIPGRQFVASYRSLVAYSLAIIMCKSLMVHVQVSYTISNSKLISCTCEAVTCFIYLFLFFSQTENNARGSS